MKHFHVSFLLSTELPVHVPSVRDLVQNGMRPSAQNMPMSDLKVKIHGEAPPQLAIAQRKIRDILKASTNDLSKMHHRRFPERRGINTVDMRADLILAMFGY